jgi:hypothetical protein
MSPTTEWVIAMLWDLTTGPSYGLSPFEVFKCQFPICLEER